jgi:hypothetical protein
MFADELDWCGACTREEARRYGFVGDELGDAGQAMTDAKALDAAIDALWAKLRARGPAVAVRA